MNNDELEISDELQNDEISNESDEEGSSENQENDFQAITLQDLETLNNNIIMGQLYIVGAIGFIVGILIGRAFNGVFRGK